MDELQALWQRLVEQSERKGQLWHFCFYGRFCDELAFRKSCRTVRVPKRAIRISLVVRHGLRFYSNTESVNIVITGTC